MAQGHYPPPPVTGRTRGHAASWRTYLIGWDKLVALAIAGYVVLFTALSMARYESFQSNAWALGAVNRLAANLRAGQLRLEFSPPTPASAIDLHSYGGLALLTLSGWLSPAPWLPLVLQAAAIGLAAYPLYLLTCRRLGTAGGAAAVALGYLLYTPLQLFTLADFSLASFAMLPLFAAQLALVRGHRRAFLIWAALAAACQIEALLVIALLGLSWAFYERAWRPGGIIAVGATGLLLCHSLVFGSLMADVLYGRPWRPDPWPWDPPTLSLAATGLAQIGRALWPLLGTPLLGPLAAITALPMLALPFLAPVLTGDFRGWYVPLLIASLFIASVEGIRSTGMIIATARHALARQVTATRERRWLALIVMTSSLLSGMVYGLLPPSTAVDRRLFSITTHDRRGAAILAQLPDGESVSAQNNLLPHLSRKKTVTLFPDIWEADYVVIDTATPWLAALDQREYVRRIVSLLADPAYGVVAIDDGYALLERGKPSAPLAETLALLYGRTIPMDEFARPIGRTLVDPLTHIGQVVWAIAPTDGAGFLIANRQLALPPGSYIATFRLAIGWRDPEESVGSLQIVTNGGRTVAQRPLIGLDFAGAGQYETFQVSFSVGEDLVEPRFYWDGKVSLRLDSVHIAPTSATIDAWREKPPR